MEARAGSEYPGNNNRLNWQTHSNRHIDNAKLFGGTANPPPNRRREKAPIPASLAAIGIGAETIGGEATGELIFSTVPPFRTIGELAAEIVARLARDGVDGQAVPETRPRITGTLRLRWPA